LRGSSGPAPVSRGEATPPRAQSAAAGRRASPRHHPPSSRSRRGSPAQHDARASCETGQAASADSAARATVKGHRKCPLRAANGGTVWSDVGAGTGASCAPSLALCGEPYSRTVPRTGLVIYLSSAFGGRVEMLPSVNMPLPGRSCDRRAGTADTPPPASVAWRVAGARALAARSRLRRLGLALRRSPVGLR
jgi:hypothetical protein